MMGRYNIFQSNSILSPMSVVFRGQQVTPPPVEEVEEEDGDTLLSYFVLYMFLGLYRYPNGSTSTFIGAEDDECDYVGTMRSKLSQQFLEYDIDNEGSSNILVPGRIKKVLGLNFKRCAGMLQLEQIDVHGKITTFDYNHYKSVYASPHLQDDDYYPQVLYDKAIGARIVEYPFIDENGRGNLHVQSVATAINPFNGDGSKIIDIYSRTYQNLVWYTDKYNFDVSPWVGRGYVLFWLKFTYSFDVLYYCKTSHSTAEKWVKKAEQWLIDNGYYAGYFQARIIPFIV